MSIATEKLY